MPTLIRHHSQKMFSTFERQVATGITDTVLINHGYQTWSGNDFGQQYVTDNPMRGVACTVNQCLNVNSTNWKICGKDRL